MIGGIFSDRRQALQAGAAAAAALLAAIALGWRAGRPAPPAPYTAAEEAWSIPALKSADPAQDLALIAARKPWSGIDSGNTDKGAAAGAKTWRFAGTVVRGQERYALIMVGKDAEAKLQYLKTGDQLPDGSSLLEIAADRVVTDGGAGAAGDKRTYQLFAAKKP